MTKRITRKRTKPEIRDDANDSNDIKDTKLTIDSLNSKRGRLSDDDDDENDKYNNVYGVQSATTMDIDHYDDDIVTADNEANLQSLIIDLQRLLHAMENYPSGNEITTTTNGPAEVGLSKTTVASVPSWRDIIARADMAESLLKRINEQINNDETGTTTTNNTPSLDEKEQKQLESLERRVIDAKKYAQQVASDMRAKDISAGKDDIVDKLFGKNRSFTPTVTPTVSRKPHSSESEENDIPNNTDLNDESNANVDEELLSQPSATVPVPPPGGNVALVTPNKTSSTNNATMVEDIRTQQREQMEEAIAQMASQMKAKTAALHNTIKKQTDILLSDMEVIAEENVIAVTELAKDTNANVRKSWSKSFSTWITLLTIIGMFIFGMLTILTIPKRQPYIIHSRRQASPSSPSQNTYDDWPSDYQQYLQDNYYEREKQHRQQENQPVRQDQFVSDTLGIDHREIEEDIKSSEIDHIDGNGFDDEEEDTIESTKATTEATILEDVSSDKEIVKDDVETYQDMDQNEDQEIKTNQEYNNNENQEDETIQEYANNEIQEDATDYDSSSTETLEGETYENTIQDTSNTENQEDNSNYVIINDETFGGDDEGVRTIESANDRIDVETISVGSDQPNAPFSDDSDDEDQNEDNTGGTNTDKSEVDANINSPGQTEDVAVASGIFTSTNANSNTAPSIQEVAPGSFQPKDIAYAAAMGSHNLLQTYLLYKREWINVQDDNGWAPIHEASLRGQTESVRILIENGCSVTLETNDQLTPLDIAERFLVSNHPVIQLLTRAMDLQPKTTDECVIGPDGQCIETPGFADDFPALNIPTDIDMRESVLREFEETRQNAQKLTTAFGRKVPGEETMDASKRSRKGPNVTFSTTQFREAAMSSDSTPLLNQYIETLQQQSDKNILMSFLNEPDEDGWTALHLAVETGVYENVKLLLSAGANYALVTRYTKNTPLDIAYHKYGGDDHITQLLEEYEEMG